MALIHFYSHLSNEHKTEIANGTLKNLYPNLNWENRIILVKGQKADCNYNAKENDIVFIREVPSDPATVALVAIGITAVAIGVAVGAEIAKNKTNQTLLENSQSSSNSVSNTSSLPFTKGAQNQGATGRSFPFLMGKMYFTPYRLCPKYYTVSGVNGVNQYVWQVLEIGLNPIVIHSISLGNVKIYEDTDEIAKNGTFNFLSGTYYDDENLIEIRQEGDFANEEFNKKISSNIVNQEIEHDYGEDAEPLIIQLAENAKAMDICLLFDGLRNYNSDSGTWEERTVIVKAYWSNKDNPETNTDDDWTELTGSENFLQQSAKTQVTKSASGTDTIKITSKTQYKKWNSWISSSDYSQIKKYIASSNAIDEDNITITSVSSQKYGTRSDDIYYKYTINFTYTYTTYEYTKAYSSTFTYNSQKQMRFIAHKDFTPEESYGKQITIKLVRTNPKTQNSSAKETVYLNFVNTEIFDVQKTKELIDSSTNLPTELVTCKPLEDTFRDMCTRIAIKMKATENNENLSDSINVIASHCVRTWGEYTDEDTNTSSKIWDDIEPSRNPAAIALDILTNANHNKSQFSDDELDLDSFGEWYEYCEENELYCDGVITEGKSKQSILEDIFALGNASLVLNVSGKYEVFIDKKEDYSVALLNTQDIQDITISKSFTRKANGRKITFVNRDTWNSESVYYMKNGTSEHTSDDTITEIAPNYITDYTHAIKYAHRQIVQDYLQPKEITVTVGNEGAYYPLYSCVDVQLPHLAVGIASAVVRKANYNDSGLLESLTISDKVNFETNKSYGIILQVQSSSGKTLLNAKVQGSGKTNILTLETPAETTYTVQSGNILSFGELDENNDFTLVRSKMKIVGISRADNGYKLKLKDYSASLYEVGSIPDYVSNATIRTNNSVSESTNYKDDPIAIKGDTGEKGADGKNGGYQDYLFAVGDFDLTDEELRALDWYDAPPIVTSGKCLYMATKWIDGE